MNKKHLRQIFANYIKKFDCINNSTHDENYKWRAAASFRELMDPDHPDFAVRLKQAREVSSNLIDGGNRYCFSALVSCAQEDCDAVRRLFKALFAEDGGDLAFRQQKILTFIEDANKLTTKHVSTNGMFMNDQRSAMGYLFLYDPDTHYLFKASEAGNFASCVEYYDDWGPGTNFRLDVFYRMCDEIVEEIRRSPALIETHNSRFVDKNGELREGMHPDRHYHILVFDLIYGAPEFRYNFYEGISFASITAQARKLHQERREKAQERYAVLIAAREKAVRMEAFKRWLTSALTVGMDVTHRAFGIGQITALDGDCLTVFFPKKNEFKKFTILSAFSGGFLKADIAQLDQKLVDYRDVIKDEFEIEDKLNRAEKAFAEYQEYLA